MSRRSSSACPVCLEPIEAPGGIVERHRIEVPDLARGGAAKKLVWCPMSGQAEFVWDEPATREAVPNRSYGICECCGHQRATDMHHRLPRSLGGGWHPSNILHLCRICHDWLEHADHRAEARARGLLLSSYDNPVMIPIKRLTGIMTFLSDDVCPPRPKAQKRVKKKAV